MNTKTKLTLGLGVLVGMIVLLVALSVVNLQILTATEPTSPAAGPGVTSCLVVDCCGGWFLYRNRTRVAGIASSFCE